MTGWAPGGINLASAVYMGNNASKSALLMAASHRAFIATISSASGSAHTGATQLMTRSRANDTSEMRFALASHLEYAYARRALTLGRRWYYH